MAKKTAIQWTDATANFWRGCKKISPGCKFCYMYRDQYRYGRDPTEVIKVNESTIEKVIKSKTKLRIFINSWSDFFIEEADQWREQAWLTIKNN